MGLTQDGAPPDTPEAQKVAASMEARSHIGRRFVGPPTVRWRSAGPPRGYVWEHPREERRRGEEGGGRRRMRGRRRRMGEKEQKEKAEKAEKAAKEEASSKKPAAVVKPDEKPAATTSTPGKSAADQVWYINMPK